MFFLPRIVIWFPALELNQTEETAGNIRLIQTGTVNKPSLGHLQIQNKTTTYSLIYVAGVFKKTK